MNISYVPANIAICKERISVLSFTANSILILISTFYFLLALLICRKLP